MTPPARGTPLADLVPATAVALVLVAVVVLAAIAHRRGRWAGLRRLDARAQRWSGLPGWAAGPIGLGTVSLLVAAFGFYWDVSWHIDRGRDPGPFANPAHYFIIAGLGGIALAGVWSVVAGVDRPTPTSVALHRNGAANRWDAPLGGLLLALCGVVALAGFPLDDIWHRIFGQDVTLWGPTHIQMIAGASLATLAMWILSEEGRRAQPDGAGTVSALHVFREHGDVFLGGAFLIGLSTLQGEFDYGVPQFNQIYHPVLIMLAAAIGLVAVRIRGGRGRALLATAFYLGLRGGLTVLIGPVLGRSTLHFPLYLVEAALVEVVALVAGEATPLALGAWSGVAIGTVGLGAEWWWSHVWMPLPWHRWLLPSGALLAALAALAGGILGALIGTALRPTRPRLRPTPPTRRPTPPRRRPARVGPGVASGAVALFCLAWPLPMSGPQGLQATVTLAPTPAASSGPRAVRPIVTLNHPQAAHQANWFDVTTWQGERHGQGGLLIAPLHRIGPDTFTTSRAIPVDGTWKALIRLHRDRTLAVVPIYLPADPAIPAGEFAPQLRYTAPFVADKKILQREATGGHVNLQRGAYLLLLLIGAGWISTLVWGLLRLTRSGDLVSGAHPGLAGARPGQRTALR